MLAHPKLASSWGYNPLDDWARGPVPRYVLGSLADRADPFKGLIAGDDVNDCSTGRFSDDVVRDDNSL
nr:hypothetical protein CFP56_55328 [Quercus suber]